ncbi:MAG TPA: ComEC/Rec2 family competence protein, partial [Micromonospora sp.]
ALAAAAALLAAAGSVHLLSARRPAGPVRRHGWIAVAVLLGVVCGAAATAGRLAVRDADLIAQLTRSGARATVELTVRDDPRALDGATAGPATFLIRADLIRLRPEQEDRWTTVSGRLLVFGTDPAWAGLLPGQRVSASGRLDSPKGGDLTAAVLSVRVAPATLGRSPWAQRAAGVLRSGLQRACAPLPDEPGGLLPGLVVGDTSRLDPAVEDDFQTTGMTHLNAVSGSNVAIVVGLVLLLARWLRAGPGLSAAICAVALFGFVILVRPSPSVVRAAVMGAVGLLALATGRPRAALPALGGAVTVLVVADPDLAGDPGFALSVLATGGLLLIAPRWRDRLRARGVPAGLAEALAVPAAAQLACAPVVAGLSGTVSLVAVPANLLAVPAIAPATVLGVVAAVVSPVWPAGAEFAAWLGGWPAWWLVRVARYGAELPAGTLPWLDGVAGGLSLGALTVALLVAARHPVVRRLVAVVVVAVLLGTLPVRLLATGWPPAGWVIALCAVGQGDTVVLPAGPGQAVVVDTGPEPAAPDRCL